MSIRKLAVAIPLLVLGLACSSTRMESTDDTISDGSQSGDHTGAMWTEKKQGQPGAQASAQQDGSTGSQDPALTVVPTAGASDQGAGSAGSGSSDQGSSSGSMGSSGSSGSGDSGAMGSGGSAGSGDSGSMGGGSAGSSDSGAMGSGGSSETMGSSPTQDSAGSSAHAAKGGQHKVAGKIEDVASDHITLAPRKKGATGKTLKISGDTKVTVNGKDADPSQLKQGDRARVTWSSQDGEDVATHIWVGSGGKHRMGRHGHMGSMPNGSSGSQSGSTGDTGGSGSSESSGSSGSSGGSHY